MAGVRAADAAIVGGGTAGMRAFRGARAVTVGVVSIEGDRRGTTCARVGWIPWKLPVAAAGSARLARPAPAFGIGGGAAGIDGRAVMGRVRSERYRFVGHALVARAALAGCAEDLAACPLPLPQRARDDDGSKTEADRFVNATGSARSVLAAAGADCAVGGVDRANRAVHAGSGPITGPPICMPTGGPGYSSVPRWWDRAPAMSPTCSPERSPRAERGPICSTTRSIAQSSKNECAQPCAA